MEQGLQSGKWIRALDEPPVVATDETPVDARVDDSRVNDDDEDGDIELGRLMMDGGHKELPPLLNNDRDGKDVEVNVEEEEEGEVIKDTSA